VGASPPSLRVDAASPLAASKLPHHAKMMPRPRLWTPKSSPDWSQIGPAPPAEPHTGGTPRDDDLAARTPSCHAWRRRLGRRPEHPSGPERARAPQACHHRHPAFLTAGPPPVAGATVRLQNQCRRAEKHYVMPPPSPALPGLANGHLGGR
jgi:hypothetical protein